MSLKTFQQNQESRETRRAARLAIAKRRCQKPRAMPTPKSFSQSGPLNGTVRVPGDKSISHRALMLSALAIGESVIEGLLEGEDVHATAAAMRAMGANVQRGSDGIWRVHGVGVGGLLQPDTALDMGNSGTSTRLLMGLVASHAITATRAPPRSTLGLAGPARQPSTTE